MWSWLDGGMCRWVAQSIVRRSRGSGRWASAQRLKNNDDTMCTMTEPGTNRAENGCTHSWYSSLETKWRKLYKFPSPRCYPLRKTQLQPWWLVYVKITERVRCINIQEYLPWIHTPKPWNDVTANTGSKYYTNGLKIETEGFFCLCIALGWFWITTAYCMNIGLLSDTNKREHNSQKGESKAKSSPQCPLGCMNEIYYISRWGFACTFKLGLCC